MKQLSLLAFTLLSLPAWAQPAAYRSSGGFAAQEAAAQQLFTANPGFQLVDLLGQQRSTVNGAVQWLDSAHAVYSYFNAANLPQRQLAGQSGQSWERQSVFHYNAAGKTLSDSSFDATTAGAFSPTPRYVNAYTFNAQNQPLTELSSETRTSGQLPVPDTRTTYTYNAQGQNTGTLAERVVNGSFQPDGRTLLTYNAQGQVVTVAGENAAGTGSQFLPTGRKLYTYNAAGQVATEQGQYFMNGAYVNSYLATATYSGPQNRLSLLTVQRNETTQPVNYALFSYTYDANGNLNQQLDRYWNDAAQSYNDAFRFFYTYQRTALATRLGGLQAGLRVAPNPTTPHTAAALHYELPVAALTGATVFDLTGRPVATVPATLQAAGPHTLALPTAPLAAGLYLVQLTAGSQSQQVKLVVE